MGFRYLGSFKMDSNADMTDLPVLLFRGMMCKNFGKASITVSRYLTSSLYLLRL
jgi:hypothetical protein